MAEFEHEVIYCIVNSGFSDAVMDAAREFGRMCRVISRRSSAPSDRAACT